MKKKNKKDLRVKYGNVLYILLEYFNMLVF